MEARTILILEDKVLLAEMLVMALERLGYSVFGTAHTAREALEMLQTGQPDLALLDIDLGEESNEMNGIDVGRHIHKHYDFPFLFLTGKDDELTLERSTEVHPAGFLLKPVSDRALHSAIQVALANVQTAPAHTPVEAADPEKDHLFVRYKGRFEKVPQSDILWVEADESYSKIHTEARTYTVTFKLKVMEERLSHPSLIRVHRSYIVNVDKVNAIAENDLLIGNQSIPVSKSYRHQLRKYFNML